MRVLSLDLEPRTDLPPFMAPRWLPPGTPCDRVVVRDGPPPRSMEPYSHLILSGSTASICHDDAFLGPVLDLIRNAVAWGRPVLGICYGHQAIARALLGRDHVRRRGAPEFGWLPVTPLPPGRDLFAGLPRPFRAFSGHFDEVCGLPPDFEVIARSEACAIQGMLCRRLKILGFQFHPEMDLATGNACFLQDREDLMRCGADIDAIVRDGRDDGSGAILIPRFLTFPWDR